MKYKINQLSLQHALEALPPSLSQVIVINDDFTPMAFVIHVLQHFFYMDRRKACEISMEAHLKGEAICGVFSKDFAETKVLQVMDYARKHDHPLKCSISS